MVEPNPTRDIFNVNIQNAKGNVVLKIVDVSGKVIQKATLNNFETSKTFSLGNKPNGIYIIQISDSNTTLTRKVIKK